MKTWPTEDDLVDALKAGEEVPDVFMVSRDDLAWLLEEGLTQPVDPLLDERGVDFGDDYSRDAVRGVQRRQPAPVHALRHLADGDVLQQGARRLRPDGGAAGSTYRPRPRRARAG